MSSTSITIYDYRYYIEGRKIAILQRNTTGIYNPYLSLNDEFYETPTISDSSAIYIRYTVSPTIWSTSPATPQEAKTLQFDDNLSLAILHYVRSMVAEDSNQERKSSYHMGRFHYYVSRHRSALRPHGKQVVVNYTGAVIKTNR